MSKLTLTQVASAYESTQAINANYALIEAAIENTVSRDGTTPNSMSANFDMNGFAIHNQSNPISVEGFNWEGPWLTSTLYSVGDVIENTGTSYICIVEHTSGTFATDLAALKWQIVAQANLPSQTGLVGKSLSTDGSSSSWEDRVTPVDDKTAAVLIAPTDGGTLFVHSADGGLFKAIVGAAPATYSDDGGSYCGTQFIPTGGDGSSVWVRVYNGIVNARWFGIDTDADAALALLTSVPFVISADTYNITSTVTFTEEVTFEPGAIFDIATATTVTFNGKLSASLEKIFILTGTGIAKFSGLTSIVYSEWWGALCNGSNDDALACQAANNALAGNGGIIQLLSRGYTFKTSLTITTHSITLRGATSGSAPIDYGAGGNDGSRIIGTDGVNCIILNAVGYAKVHDINIHLPVGATSSTVGIRIISSFLPKIYDCRITNFSNGIHLTNTTDTYIDRCYISSTDVTVSPVIGIEIDGGSSTQNPTVNISHCISAHGAYSGIAYGYYLHGERINDVFLDLCEADFCTQGFFIDGTSGDTNYGADIHLRGCVADGNVANGFLVQNLNVDSMIEIINGWSAGGTINIYSTSSSKVTVSGMQVFGGQHGIYIRDSSQATVTDNILSYQTGSHIVIDNNPASTISNNQFHQKAATPASTGINLLTGSDHCTIMGNVGYGPVAGSIGSGVVTAIGCDYCNIIGNIMDSNSVTTPYTLNLGSNTNSVQLGTTA